MPTLSPNDRMWIAGFLSEIMRSGPRTFEFNSAVDLVEAMPFCPLVIKHPYFGRNRSEDGVEGFAPGIGNVRVSGEPKGTPEYQDPQNSELRFGVWDVSHKEGVLRIDHMWSHHVGSTFWGRTATLCYSRDATGRIDRFVLLKFTYELHWRFCCPRIVAYPEILKWDNRSTEDGVRSWLDEPQEIPDPDRPQPVRIVGFMWLTGLGVLANILVMYLQHTHLGTVIPIPVAPLMLAAMVAMHVNLGLGAIMRRRMTFAAASAWSCAALQLCLLIGALLNG